MLESIGCEYSNDTISTGTKQAIIRSLNTESSLNFNIHPFNKFSMFIINVNMAISS
jgi:hypothetical protein